VVVDGVTPAPLCNVSAVCAQRREFLALQPAAAAAWEHLAGARGFSVTNGVCHGQLLLRKIEKCPSKRSIGVVWELALSLKRLERNPILKDVRALLASRFFFAAWLGWLALETVCVSL